MMAAYIPYGAYWSTPFSKWQGSIAHLHSMKLAARTVRRALDTKRFPLEKIDFGILGITNPQPSSFYGLPWVTAMMGLDRVAGPTVQHACATSARVLEMAAHEIATETSTCVLTVTADRCSNGAIVYYPDPTAPGGSGITERWVLDNFSNDPYADNAMVDTAENVAARYGFTREEQHEVKLQRHAQYQQALAHDRAFQRRYMIDVDITDAGFRRSMATLIADEGIFPTTADGLAKLKPVNPNGTVTFGSQTHPADGNAGAIVTTRELARALSREPIDIELVAFGTARAEKGYMPLAPVMASQRALEAANVDLKNVDAVKSHNPFAVNDLVFSREIGYPLDMMNNYGCSLIFGHPQAPTGMRSMIELIEELAERGGGVGLFNGCAAGDSAMAAVVRVTDAR